MRTSNTWQTLDKVANNHSIVSSIGSLRIGMQCKRGHELRVEKPRGGRCFWNIYCWLLHPVSTKSGCPMAERYGRKCKPIAMHPYTSLLGRTVSRCPRIIILRQHQLLHMPASDPNISSIENRQHHGRIQQIREWAV